TRRSSTRRWRSSGSAATIRSSTRSCARGCSSPGRSTTRSEPMAITRDSLLSLEAYAKARGEFRARVLAHKKPRTVHLGDHVTLIFEDELTIRYPIQEMLRIEKTFEEKGIEEELDAYNPLVPDGSNFKATMLIEYEDPVERAEALARL